VKNQKQKVQEASDHVFIYIYNYIYIYINTWYYIYIGMRVYIGMRDVAPNWFYMFTN